MACKKKNTPQVKCCIRCGRDTRSRGGFCWVCRSGASNVECFDLRVLSSRYGGRPYDDDEDYDEDDDDEDEDDTMDSARRYHGYSVRDDI